VRAKREGKPVILDFYATWCTDCVRMEKTTFADPRVRAALKNYVLLQADVTDNNDASIAIKQKFGVFGPPACCCSAPMATRKRTCAFTVTATPRNFSPCSARSDACPDT